MLHEQPVGQLGDMLVVELEGRPERGADHSGCPRRLERRLALQGGRVVEEGDVQHAANHRAGSSAGSGPVEQADATPHATPYP